MAWHGTAWLDAPLRSVTVQYISQKCTRKGIWRQGIVLKYRNSLQKSLCPVVLCPYLCSSESHMTVVQCCTVQNSESHRIASCCMSLHVFTCLRHCHQRARAKRHVKRLYVTLSVALRYPKKLPFKKTTPKRNYPKKLPQKDYPKKTSQRFRVNDSWFAGFAKRRRSAKSPAGWYNILYCTILYYTMLYYAMLYYTIIYYIIL